MICNGGLIPLVQLTVSSIWDTGHSSDNICLDKLHDSIGISEYRTLGRGYTEQNKEKK